MIPEEPKVLTGSDQKGEQSRMQTFKFCITDDALSAERENLTHSVQEVERGKPVVLPMGKPTVRKADRNAGKGLWRKRKSCCNDKDRN